MNAIPPSVSHDTLVGLTANIVSAHVANNPVEVSGLPILIEGIFGALSAAGSPPAEAEEQEPAVAVGRSIRKDYLVCLEDGKKLKMLKRYLRTNFDMSPDEYRAKWNLPSDYPMVAPAYAEKRRELAKKIGLGKNPTQRRGRRKRSS